MKYIKTLFLLAVFSSLNLKAQETMENFNPGQVSLTPERYLDHPQFSVLCFHNNYPVGKQGGVEFILRDRRLMTNGNVVFEYTDVISPEPFVDGAVLPNGTPEKEIIKDQRGVQVSFKVPEAEIDCHIRTYPVETGIKVELWLEDELDDQYVREGNFRMELFPGILYNRSYFTDKEEGFFPRYFNGHMDEKGRIRAMARGSVFHIAPEMPEISFNVRSETGTIRLIDDRGASRIGWFVLEETIPFGTDGAAVSWIIEPVLFEDYVPPPKILTNQVGYYPARKKKAVLEFMEKPREDLRVELVRLQSDGSGQIIEELPAESWGSFLRYWYAVADFSHVEESGIYRIQYGDASGSWFEIKPDVYATGVWQPGLYNYFPQQMCHVQVRETGKLWHSACHLDDGVQAPPNTSFFDGFRQGPETLNDYQPDQTIPGLNQGGYHDAGDDDINTHSTGNAIYHLILAEEAFDLPGDQTLIDYEKKEVEIFVPDGEKDALQQIVHGLRFLLPQFDISDHSIVGVISHDFETYLQSGDWSGQTDNLFYDPNMAEDQRDGTYSGKNDDRYIFTTPDSRRDYYVCAIFAAAYRVLKEAEPEIAAECLQKAMRIWQVQSEQEPDFYGNVGTGGSLIDRKTQAAADLYLSTGNRDYLLEIEKDKEKILDEIELTAWSLARVPEEDFSEAFYKEYKKVLKEYAASLSEQLGQNPFGVIYPTRVWGIGWEILWLATEYYYLHESFPELFPPDYLNDAVDFVLGCHPGSDMSFVSTVGRKSLLSAFGINRADESYQAGGVYSGTAMILPDFPELKENHPYLWQQSEYMIHGTSPFIFCVRAVEHINGVEP